MLIRLLRLIRTVLAEIVGVLLRETVFAYTGLRAPRTRGFSPASPDN